MNEEEKIWATVLEFDVSTLNPLGVCRSPAAKAINHALGLPGRAVVAISGERIPGSDNFKNGTLFAFLDVATTSEQIEAIRAAISSAQPCTDDDAGRRVKLADLNDIASETRLGELVFVANLPRLTGVGQGAWVYKGRQSKWYRVADDTEVIAP